MDLNNLRHFKELDLRNMLAEIDGLPDQLAAAFALGLQQPLPDWKNLRHALIAGMGASAIGADLLAAYVASSAPVPVSVHRDYGLPEWARGEGVLVIAVSHSGNTEETLDAFESARQNGCRILVITTGGELAKRAKENGLPLWTFTHTGPPSAAVGYFFGMLLALVSRLGLVASQTESVAGAVEAMKQSQEHLRADIPIVNNPAKREAGQLMGRWVTVVGAGLLAPMARRIKMQINLLAHAGANVEILPEANHAAVAGLALPEEVRMPHTITLFLRAPSDHARNRLRTELTQRDFMVEGLNTDFINARGETPLAHLWTLVLFGDYLAYYLAMCYEVNPGSMDALENFKSNMKEAR
jgi:glucose/mannose-6-phosphate isomerase